MNPPLKRSGQDRGRGDTGRQKSRVKAQRRDRDGKGQELKAAWGGEEGVKEE